MQPTPPFQNADTSCEQLLVARQGLGREALEALSARLILILATQVGDARVLAECIAAASHATLTSARRPNSVE